MLNWCHAANRRTAWVGFGRFSPLGWTSGQTACGSRSIQTGSWWCGFVARVVDILNGDRWRCFDGVNNIYIISDTLSRWWCLRRLSDNRFFRRLVNILFRLDYWRSKWIRIQLVISHSFHPLKFILYFMARIIYLAPLR